MDDYDDFECRESQMKGHGQKKARKEEKAIACLLQCSTIGEAAAAAGIGKSTLERWLRNAAFREKYRSAREQVLSDTVARLQQLTGTATETLAELMGPETGSTARLGAAKAILEMAFRGKENDDLEARLVALEKEIPASGGSCDR